MWRNSAWMSATEYIVSRMRQQSSAEVKVLRTHDHPSATRSHSELRAFSPSVLWKSCTTSPCRSHAHPALASVEQVCSYMCLFIYICTGWAKKLHPFFHCNNFIYLRSILIIFSTYTSYTNRVRWSNQLHVSCRVEKNAIN